ncbi:MAG: Ig-like domain-containing protein [Gemmatimonadota bacterium]|nr:Ig-like domain-containing protein [Gemmatimonadota bacterium]
MRTGLALALAAVAGLVACDAEPLSRIEPASQVVEIRLIVGADRLVEGDTTRAQAIPLDLDGDTVNVSVRWSSTDVAVARVDGTGEIEAVDEGRASIVAQAGGIAVRSPLTVVQRVASIEIPGEVAGVTVGDTVQLVAEMRDAAGRAVLDRNPRWGTTDPSVASVSKGGSVRGQSPGVAEVSARIDAVADTIEARVVAREPR